MRFVRVQYDADSKEFILEGKDLTGAYMIASLGMDDFEQEKETAGSHSREQNCQPEPVAT